MDCLLSSFPLCALVSCSALSRLWVRSAGACVGSVFVWWRVLSGCVPGWIWSIIWAILFFVQVPFLSCCKKLNCKGMKHGGGRH